MLTLPRTFGAVIPPPQARRASSPARQYCRWFQAGIAALLLLVGAMNILVDPYWVHRGPWSSYWNPTIQQVNSRFAKGEVAACDPIDVALLGDSRVLNGLDPAHPALNRLGQTYNLGMNSLTVEEATRVLGLLLGNQKHQPKLVLWVIQPEFLVYDRRPKYHYDYRLSRLNPEQDATSRWLHSIWSREATARSWSLLTGRASPAVSLGCVVAAGEREPVNREFFTTHCARLQQLYLQAGEAPAGVEMAEPVGQLFSECAQRGIRLEVVIPPSHAIYWECLQQIGWGDRVELGKRTLLQLAETANRQAPGANDAPVRVWDFSGFSGPAAESVPEEATAMRWHADPVHFTRRLGDLLIDRVTGGDVPFDHFGTRLTAVNLEAHLAGWTTELASYSAREQKQQMALGGSAKKFR